MNEHLIILFIVVPMLAGLVTILLHRLKPAQRVTGLIFLILNVVVALVTLAAVYSGPDEVGRILVSQMGNWPAPFGITVVVDPLAAIMLVISSIVCLAVFIYCVHQLDDRFAGGYFHPLFHLLMFGVQWTFITGDLFNLFVAFEIMLMASYAMFCVGTTRPQMRQAYKYILLNLIASTLFITCAGLLYGQFGTLNMADMARIALNNQIPTTAVPVIAILLLVFGMKTAIFPLWYWLPDTYHTLPAAIVGLFAGLLTKVGAYVMIRVFVMMFGTSGPVVEVVAPIILISAGVTMFLGVLGAVSMNSVRRILSIHIISQLGYMIMGVGLGMGAVGPLLNSPSYAAERSLKELAVAGAIFFIIHNMVVKCCLFLCGGLMQEHAGSDDLDRIGGLLRRAPWLATLFLIAALSLAGLPPLSGFFGKWALIKACLDGQYYLLVGLAVATSLLTLLSMLKIWSYGFWSPPRGAHVNDPTARPRTTGGIMATALLVAVALSMGLGAQSYMNVSLTAARSLVDPRSYIASVLGPERVPEFNPHDLESQRADPRMAAAPDPAPMVPGLASTEIISGLSEARP